MKKIQKILMVLCLFTSLFLIHSNLPAETESFISPKVNGFALKSKPAYYSPDNLYEYINGAADLYLNFHFKKLSVFEYRNKKKGSITVDIYEHKDINNGFGIYCSEKPSDGPFLKIGTEGYYEH